MFSVPLICSSSGVATVSATVSGLAPGNRAVTTTEGGTTSGYSEIGNCIIAIRPARKMPTEITPAKIGRSMKNLDKDMLATRPARGAGSIARGAFRLRSDGGAGRQALQVIEDHAVACLDAREHDAFAG